MSIGYSLLDSINKNRPIKYIHTVSSNRKRKSRTAGKQGSGASVGSSIYSDAFDDAQMGGTVDDSHMGGDTETDRSSYA